MRRILAVALAAGVLLIGGCDRQHAQSSGQTAVSGAPAAPPGTATTTGKSTRAGGQPAATGAGDVDSLLGDVDKQLSSDAQPVKDSD
jgi:hypothetical protein